MFEMGELDFRVLGFRVLRYGLAIWLRFWVFGFLGHGLAGLGLRLVKVGVCGYTAPCRVVFKISVKF